MKNSSYLCTMIPKIFKRPALFLVLLVVSCKPLERSTDTIAATVRDSVSFSIIDSTFIHHIFDSVSLTIRDTSRIVQFVRVRQNVAHSQVTHSDTTTVHQSDTVATQTTTKPGKKKLVTLRDIPIYLVILIIGCFLREIVLWAWHIRH